MKNVQNSDDKRGIHIDKSEVSDLRYAITVLNKTNKAQATAGTFSLSVDLPHHFLRTHMSRIVKVLNGCHGEVALHTVPALLKKLKKQPEADRGACGEQEKHSRPLLCCGA